MTFSRQVSTPFSVVLQAPSGVVMAHLNVTEIETRLIVEWCVQGKPVQKVDAQGEHPQQAQQVALELTRALIAEIWK